MKVVLIHNSYQQPGGEDVVFDQEREMLVRHGHEVVAYRRSNWEVEGYRGLKRLSLMADSVWRNSSKQEIDQLLRVEKPDLVHVHNTFVMMSPSIYSACQERETPIVQTLHNYRLFCPGGTFFRDGRVCEDCVTHNLWHSVAHGCYRHSRLATTSVVLMLTVHRQQQTWSEDIDAYIALTTFAKKKFVKAGLPEDKIAVKPNFVYPDPGMRTNRRGEYALFVGRLSPEKRVTTLLAAWSRLRSDIRLRVLGGGPEREQLEKEAIAAAGDKVTFEGHVSREQIIQAMHGARFLVFSSEWYENFPVTLAESFACGLPVVCTRLGAMEEIVEDGRTGLHFNPGDAEDLAEKVEWAWNHPAEMRRMGIEARLEYEHKYTAERNYPMLMQIYREAMESSALTCKR